jgi:N-acetylgalactosamine kinase
VSDRPVLSIILAAGKGTRMGCASQHKVCCEIAGRPAILRALDTYAACGFGPHVIVVGDRASDVMATASRSDHSVLYAYQPELRGTGHATRLGARILRDLGYDGPVLVVAGDKVIEQLAIQKLQRVFERDECDMALLVGRRQGSPELGRIVIDHDGEVLACVEQRDLRQRRALQCLRSLALAAGTGSGGVAELRTAALDVLRREIPDDRKARIAFGSLLARLCEPEPLPTDELLTLVPEAAGRFEFVRPDGQMVHLAPDEVDETPWVNLSVYLFEAAALYYGLDCLTSDNAQGEEYLTDVVGHLQHANAAHASAFRLRPVAIDHSRQVMAFNTPAELAEIEAYYQGAPPG